MLTVACEAEPSVQAAKQLLRQTESSLSNKKQEALSSFFFFFFTMKYGGLLLLLNSRSFTIWWYDHSFHKLNHSGGKPSWVSGQMDPDFWFQLV